MYSDHSVSSVALHVAVPIAVGFVPLQHVDLLLLSTPTWLFRKAIVMNGGGGIHQPMRKGLIPIKKNLRSILRLPTYGEHKNSHR